MGPGYQVPLARAVKAATGMPTIAVGLITEFEQAEAIVGTGDADLVALARTILYDPRWPWHAAAHFGATREGAEAVPPLAAPPLPEPVRRIAGHGSGEQVQNVPHRGRLGQRRVIHGGVRGPLGDPGNVGSPWALLRGVGRGVRALRAVPRSRA